MPSTCILRNKGWRVVAPKSTLRLLRSLNTPAWTIMRCRSVRGWFVRPDAAA